MEGRVRLDFVRNTTEELFIKAVTESAIGTTNPTIETLGFRNLSQNFRVDSEELFKSWLTTGENNSCSSTSIATRTRQASRRIFTEPSNLSNQQTDDVLQKSTDDIPLQQSSYDVAGASTNFNQHSIENVAESECLQATNLFLAKAWFHSSQPMTRSRSNELRRRYAATHNLQTSIGVEAALMHNIPENDVNSVIQESADRNGFNDVQMYEGTSQFYTFNSPMNSNSSNFSTQQVNTTDKISSVVSMLKGTLERKKLSNKLDKGAVDEHFFEYYGDEILSNMNFNEGQDPMYEIQGSFQDLSTFQVSDTDVLKAVEGSVDVNLGVLAPTNTIQMSMVSQEPSQSESSAAALVLSTAYDTCDDSNSGQATIVCESSTKQTGHGPKQKDKREHTYDNMQDDAKKGGLVRHGSITPPCSVDEGNPTKKRRVERSRKMAEAKERNSSPAIPSDVRSLLKRCENLDKEVRSLKLNLAFMNRKDSEQTKLIEELQKENKDLAEEKERLLEELERVTAETGKV